MRIHNVKLDADELVRLKIMDAYGIMQRDGKVNVRYLCRLMGVGKPTFYKWKKRYKRYNLNTIKTRSRRPKYLADKNINHQYTWIHTPDQNGCVERSHKTDDEFYHLVETKDLTLEELNDALESWAEYYNTERLHFSLNFDTPDEYLQKHKVSTI